MGYGGRISSQKKRHVLFAVLGFFFAGLVPAAAQKPLAIYVLDFDTNISGENRAVAARLTTSIETAFSQLHSDFKVLERRRLKEIIHQYKMERDLSLLSRGDRPSPEFIRHFSQADGVLRGELNEDHLGGVVLTLSLTRLDSEKLWQSQKTHTLYEWLNGELRTKDAMELASSAAASINVPLKATPHIAEDAVRGTSLAEQGHCQEAMPFLQNAAAVDSKNTEVFYQMGRCQNQAGDYEAAVDSLRSAIETNPRRPDLFVERAISFSALKDFQTALRDLDQALKIDSGNLIAIELRGDVFMERRLFAEAVNAYYEVYRQQATRSRCAKLAAAYLKNGARDASALLERICGPLP